MRLKLSLKGGERPGGAGRSGLGAIHEAYSVAAASETGRGSRSREEDNQGTYRDANYDHRRHPWSFCIAPTT